MCRKMHNMLPFRACALLAGAYMLAHADALVQQYCSSDNTGSDYAVFSNTWQSNGLCHDHCNAEYAFAVVQYASCWCTNYAPADTVSVSNCNQGCPGFPQEKCGNADGGYYGYIALDKSPAGTAGASTPSSTTAPQSSTTAPSSTPEPETSYTSSTTSEIPETTEEPVTSVIMTTISGAVVTQTVTSTPVVASESNGQQPLDKSDGLSAGAIAGIVIGILAAFAVLGAALFFLWSRRRQDRAEDGEGSPSGARQHLGRNVSVLSKAGLLTRTRPSMGEHDDATYVTPATGQNSVRHSMLFGPGMGEGVNPASPLGSSHGSEHSRRPSKPMVYDQRLNPSALFANAEANGSRISMQDQQDYSRPLGVVNPDPRPSFESRISRV